MAASSRSSLGDRADNGSRPASPLWNRGARAFAVGGKRVSLEAQLIIVTIFGPLPK
jgi:hypothetical protein